MNVKFFESVIEKHKQISHVVSNNEIKTWTFKTIAILFPTSPAEQLFSLDQVKDSLEDQKAWLLKILQGIKSECPEPPELIVNDFFASMPKIYSHLKEDVGAILTNDPAARSELEIIRSYPGFLALSFHRIAHQLYKQKVPLIPRIIAEAAHNKTGI